MKAPLYTQVHRGVLHLVYANDRKVVRQREETGGNGTRADMEGRTCGRHSSSSRDVLGPGVHGSF